MEHAHSSAQEGFFRPQRPVNAPARWDAQRWPRAQRATLKTWTALPHGKLSAVDDNVLTVTGDISMPLGFSSRRMTVVRLSDGGLVIFNAITLDENEMLQLEAFGTPAWLIVPSDRHPLEAKVWKNRYPALRVVAPEGAREKVAEFVAVDASEADFGDPAVRLIDVPGADGRDAALEITTAKGVTLVVNELIGNIRSRIGLEGLLARVMGFPADQPAPADPEVFDRKIALADEFALWARRGDLVRIVVSHGEIIEDDPQGVLRWLAAELIGG